MSLLSVTAWHTILLSQDLGDLDSDVTLAALIIMSIRVVAMRNVEFCSLLARRSAHNVAREKDGWDLC